ncbi:sensor histidine kinase [Novosphingobium panipatense]|uniref:sensor histidine kinase n=1 Tax=Novosphingobium panipatense TaxID=428991 RepID=UPI0036095E07
MIEMLDITERRRAEETQRLLIGELNHRVKNTLATVQAIASQGFRHARSHKDFQDAFTGRLQALSRAHSMLSATTWESAGLRSLIADHVAIGAVSEERLLLDGPDVDLSPELALRFSLVFHELATNAHKYGAFSMPSARCA